MYNLFEYDFIQRAFLAGTLIGLIAPMIGIFLVVKRLSGLSDSVSHMALAGVAVGLLLGIFPSFSALVFAILAGCLIELIRLKTKIFAESVLVLIIASSLSVLGIIQSFSNFSINLSSFLFGSLTTVQENDIWWILLITISVIFVVHKYFWYFFKISFDEEIAMSQGVKVNFWNLILVILSSAVISSGIRLVGGLLISSLTIIPVISSQQLGFGFKKSMYTAMIISVFSVWSGLILAWFANLPAGASIVLINILIFLTIRLLK